MSVKLTPLFFNRDKHLAALFHSWMHIQSGARKRTESGSYPKLLRSWMRMERVCRPDSVRRSPGVTVIRLGPRSPGGSSHQPARTEGRPSRREPHACLFGVAPGGVWRAVPVTGNAVGSYPTVSPLPVTAFAAPSAVCSLCHCPSPWARPEERARCAWPLASTPPSGVRTFLPGIAAPATVRPAPATILSARRRRPAGRRAVLVAVRRPPYPRSHAAPGPCRAPTGVPA